MAFADTLKELPFTPRTPNGSGFLPPMFRASTHINFLLACIADEKVTVDDAEALDELKQAKTHWDARVITPALSTGITAYSTLIGKALDETIAEYGKWKPEQRIANLRDLGHRIAQMSANLDRELVGNREADAGTSL